MFERSALRAPRYAAGFRDGSFEVSASVEVAQPIVSLLRCRIRKYTVRVRRAYRRQNRYIRRIVHAQKNSASECYTS